MTKDEAQRLLRRPIAFHRAFVSIAGGVNAGLMLSQAWYWKDHTNDPDGWFWKTRREWEAETGLSRTEQENARRILRERGLIEESLKGMPAKTHFRVDVDAVLLAISQDTASRQESRQQGGRKAANKVARKPPAGSRQESGHQDSANPANQFEGKAPSFLHAETTSEITHTKEACVLSDQKSRFDLVTCERFAQQRRGLTNPGGYATTIFRSGEADGLIEQWLANGSNGNAPTDWRSFYGEQLNSILRALPADDKRRALVESALLRIPGPYEDFKIVREQLLDAGFQIA